VDHRQHHVAGRLGSLLILPVEAQVATFTPMALHACRSMYVSWRNTRSRVISVSAGRQLPNAGRRERRVASSSARGSRSPRSVTRGSPRDASSWASPLQRRWPGAAIVTTCATRPRARRIPVSTAPSRRCTRSHRGDAGPARASSLPRTPPPPLDAPAGSPENVVCHAIRSDPTANTWS
jgi:hypothetical protein